MRRWILLGALLLAAPRAAEAQVACDTLPNPIYLRVGDTQSALMLRLGRALRDNTNKPLTLVWVTSGSCINIAAIQENTPVNAASTMRYVPSIAENPDWTPANSFLTCTTSAATNLDIGNSALFNSACDNYTPIPEVRDALGPVQAYVLAVPEASSQTAITFEEAYFVFGFGTAGMIDPWNDELQMFIRPVTTSTLLAWAANITVPASSWKGIRPANMGSPDVVAALQSSPTPEKAIGILGAEVYDGERGTLNALAFRARGQYAAYFPDSTATSFDKKNLRDGHYTVWSPTVWMDRVNPANMQPLNPDARYVIDLIIGRTVTPAINFDMTKVVADVGLVPDCAMGVKRAFEGGPLSLYEPPESCVCKYESLVATTSCAQCSGAAPCASGVCRNGYCEVR